MSESHLRRLLRECGIPLDPVVEGVRQDSFENLEKTLLALGDEYAAALAAGDRKKAERCRQAVITGKDHARLSARKAGPEKRAQKQEMISWMLVWLENPEAFPAWLRLRKRAAPELASGT